MKPDNNSLNRTYFIGGSPRIGKTTLAYALAEKIKGHVVSTDSIRSAAKKARLEKTGDLFRTNFYNNLSEEEWLERHLHHPEIAIDDQNPGRNNANYRLLRICPSINRLIDFIQGFKNRDRNSILQLATANTEYFIRVAAANPGDRLQFSQTDSVLARGKAISRIDKFLNQKLPPP